MVCLDIAVLRDGRQKPLSRPSTRHGKPGPHAHSATATPHAFRKTECASARLSLRKGWKPEGSRPAKRGFGAADSPVPQGGAVELPRALGPSSRSKVEKRNFSLDRQIPDDVALGILPDWVQDGLKRRVDSSRTK